MNFLHATVPVSPGGTLEAIPGASPAFLVAGLPAGRRLVLTESDTETRRWGRELAFFRTLAGGQPPAVVLSPDEAHAGERIGNLRRALENEADILVMSTAVAGSPMPDVKGFAAAAVTVSQGEEIEPALLADLLEDLGYRRVSIVADAGEFAVRGGIFDLFCPGETELPLRVEFFGDRIESLRLFEVANQRSVRTVAEMRIPPAVEHHAPETIIEAFPDFQARIQTFEGDDPLPASPSTLRVTTLTGDAGALAPLAGLGLTAAERKTTGSPIESSVDHIRELSRQAEVLLVCTSLGEAERARDILSEGDVVAPILGPERVPGYEGRVAITTGDLSGGFRVSDPAGIVLTSGELFGARPTRRRPRRPSRVAGLLASLDDLTEGDFVVHEDHGVGRYRGLRRLDAADVEDDVLVVEYAGGDLFYLPVGSIGRLRSYHSGTGSVPHLDKLGGRTWKKTRTKVRKRVREMAAELVRLYARRAQIRGHAFSETPTLYDEFVDAFPYEETPDQLTAETEIFAAMEAPIVMDRLLCGDVGYGKTEVAMRAAFKTVADGKQVAVLVPTTILAEQHFETFSSRFAPFPVMVDFLSRFKTPTAQKKTVTRVVAGEIDIVIGTHRLLAKDVSLPNLGLLIIDEEHKFGVAHKERLQQLAAHVDVLTLSATPIPRTLHMALAGIRGISTIETPPEERMAVKTLVGTDRDAVIAEALEREFRRGGQAYFVHNRVESIYRVGSRLQEQFPRHTVGIAHGQMRERELEHAMHGFFHGETDVLLCTSIIGSGLDVPRANTIIVDRADTFGLADLYQLRGRVGRSDVRAYAYLLIPGENVISDEARERLQAIRDLSYLGAGFRLAMKDLEIRGAGNLLGAEQSGHVEAVGFDLYTEMLEEAVAEIRGEPATSRLDPVVDLPVEARIPETYIEDTTLRFTLYRRIAAADSREVLEDLAREMTDRFGPYPPEVAHLLDVVAIKVQCRLHGIPAIRWRKSGIHAELSEKENSAPENLLELGTRCPDLVRFLPEGGLAIVPRDRSWEAIRNALREFFGALGQPDVFL